jgi:hypothetical protein
MDNNSNPQEEKVPTEGTPPIEPVSPVKNTEPKDTLATKSAMLHTYKQDVQGLVRKRQVSLVNALALQSDKEGHLTENKVEPSSSKLLLLVSITMLVLGGIAIFVAYGAYTIQQESLTESQNEGPIDDTMIFVEHRARLNATDRLPRETSTELTRILTNSQATLGSITQIIIEWSVWDDSISAKRTFPISQSQLIQVLGLSLPDQFIRLLGGEDEYIVGMHVADRNTPFILLTTQSHEHAFAAMLDWENVAEVQLGAFFATEGSNSSKRTVEDIIIQNIDARAVRDEDRTIKLLYAFLDRETVLITNNIHTLTEVARRYSVRKGSGSADIPTEFMR